MRRTPPHRTPTHSPGATLVVSLGMLGLLFGFMIAVSYPVTTAMMAIAGVVAFGATRTIELLTRKEAVCVPGTDVCIRLTLS